MEDPKLEVYLLKRAGHLSTGDYKRVKAQEISQTLLEALGFANLETMSRKTKYFIIFSIKCNTL